MQLLQQLSSFALSQLIDGAFTAIGPASGERTAEAVIGFLSSRFSDHSQRLPHALKRANDNAWKAVEIALAGESLWNWLDRAEEKAFREQVRAFLDATPLTGLPGDGQAFRKDCLRELRAARKAGLLDSGDLSPADLASTTGSFARFSDPQGLLEAERQAVESMGEELRRAEYVYLGRLVALRTGGPESRPLLVMAVRYFFRREVESDRELYQGLSWAKLEVLQDTQDRHFAGLAEVMAVHAEAMQRMLDGLQTLAVETHGVVQDIRSDVLDLARRFDLLHRELRPRDSLSIGSDTERQLVKQVIARYRALPEEQRRALPDLLNAVGKLEVATGAFDAAQRDFQQAAVLSSDAHAQAEAHFNAYGAALERSDWPAALASLQQAVTLEAARFGPFPMHKYEPERILGAGGFGVAFLCRNRHSGSRVVVKALRTDTLERAVDDVFREARILEELEHPAVIRLRDCDYADAAMTRPYLVMDYFDGLTLAEHVEKHGPVSPESLLALIRPVAEALKAAHACGILHRDVKPANLLVRHDPEAGSWRVKLIDFGLALKQNVLRASVGSTGPRSITSYSIAGTLDYAAPEQVGKLPGVTVGTYSDVYGFGRTCCHALFKTVQPLRRHWRAVPEDLADLLEQCLCEEPRDRLANFEKVLERLPGAPQRESSGTVVETLKKGFTKLTETLQTLTSTTPAPQEKAPAPADPRREWWRATAEEGGATCTIGEVRRFKGHGDGVYCVAFAPDGRQMLSGGADNLVRLWEVQSGKELCRLEGHAAKVWAVQFTPDGRYAVSASKDKSVRLWDLNRGTELRSWPGRTNRAVALSPDGKLALSGSVSDGMVRLWEINTGRELRRFKGHMSWVLSVAFSPDGLQGLSSSADGTVRLWEVDTGRELRRLQGHRDQVWSAIFLHNAHALSASADRTVRLWDLRSGKEVRCYDNYTDQIWSVAASPVSRYVASDGDGWTVRVWDVKHGRDVALQGHGDKVMAVAFAPDGRFVASGSLDKTVILWALPGG